MKLRPEQVPGPELQPVYLITGDEPLLVEEAADAVRAAARAAGYSEREVFFANRTFNWAELADASRSMSLFAQRRVLDVRIENLPGVTDAKVIKAFCEAPPPDTLLLMTAPRMEVGRGWARAVDAVGAVVQAWPIRAREMPRWLKERARAAGVELDQDAFALLLERVEGNLLAARQELDRLRLLGDGRWDAERLMAATADSSRFDAFGWVDAVFLGDLPRALRILEVLQAEGAQPIMVNGALNSQLRRLAALAATVGGQNLDGVLKRQGFFADRARAAKALLARTGAAELAAVQARLAAVDLCAKGAPGDPWVGLADVAVALCRAPAPRPQILPAT